MESKVETQIVKDLKNKKLRSVGNLMRPWHWFGRPGRRVSYWISGGHQNHGWPKPNLLVLKKVVPGFMR